MICRGDWVTTNTDEVGRQELLQMVATSGVLHALEDLDVFLLALRASIEPPL